MKHNYFYFNKEELLRDPKIPIYVMKDEQAVFKEMAMEMVEEIESVRFLFARWDQQGSTLILWNLLMKRILC